MRTSAVRAAAQAPQRFEVALQDASTLAPIGGAQLAVCTRTDEDCARPASRGVTDASGTAMLDAPGGPTTFDGFVRVSGADDIATHYAFLPNRVASCTACIVVLPLYTPSALRAMAQSTGLNLDEGGGLVRVDVEDCAGAPAEDVTVSIGSFGCSEAGPPFEPGRRGFPFGPQGCAGPIVAYGAGGHGSISRTALSTDSTGVALGFGVPAGQLGIAGLRDGKTVAGALGFARAGAVSTFVVRP